MPMNSQLTTAITSGRIHSAYLFSGPKDKIQALAQNFVRALVCKDPNPDPCESCDDCRRSAQREEIALDGSGRSGPLYRHIGEHPDLLWIERGQESTRVRIGQIRAVQSALRLQAFGNRRALVIEDAEWLNLEAQNGLLRILEEPPPKTCVVLVTSNVSSLLGTVRSRCQNIQIPATRRIDPSSPEASGEERDVASRIEGLANLHPEELLEWAEDFRGPRGPAAERALQLLEIASTWLHLRISSSCQIHESALDQSLRTWDELRRCRKSLSLFNANPQMIVERALFALNDLGNKK